MYSVVIPGFNCSKTIQKCIESIINQDTKSEYEIIYVDDCSKDNSIEIVKKFSTIKIYSTKKNSGGPALPRNIGIKNCKDSNRIFFCDSDDIWRKNHISVIENIIKENNKFNDQIICTIFDDFVNDYSYQDIKKNTRPELKIFKYKEIFLKNRICTSSISIPKSLLNINQFNEDKNYIAVEDYDLWLRLLKIKKQIIRINLITGGYRVQKGSLSKNKVEMIKKVLRVQYKSTSKINFFLLFPLLIHSYALFSIRRLYKKRII